MADPVKIAARLTPAQRYAVTRSFTRPTRAGELFPGRGKMEAQGWLRSCGLFERYFHTGFLAYRLSALGEAVRRELERERQS